MHANRINSDHVLAKSWMNFKLAEMESAEPEKDERGGMDMGGRVDLDVFEPREEVQRDDLNQTGGEGRRRRKGKGKKKGRRRGKGVVGKFGGMENFMNSHGIKPYDDGAFEDANAILDQLRGVKQEAGA